MNTHLFCVSVTQEICHKVMVHQSQARVDRSVAKLQLKEIQFFEQGPILFRFLCFKAQQYLDFYLL